MNLNYEFIENLDGSYIKTFVARIGRNDLHWHRQIEILYVINGAVEVRESSRLYTLRSNDIAVISSKEVHAVNKLQNNRVLILQIDPEISNNFYPSLDEIKFECNSALNIAEEYYEPFQKMREYMSSILNSIGYKDVSSIFKIMGLTNLILSILFEKFPCRKTDEKARNIDTIDLERLNKVFEFVAERYMEDFNLEDLSKLVCVSKFYLAHFFKNKTGITLGEYISSVRLNKATEKILRTNQTISFIASECGFKSAKYFNKVFKNKMKCTPSQFKYSKKREYLDNNEHGNV